MNFVNSDYDPDYDDPNAFSGICDYCGEECEAVGVDEGFDYEYGSERGYHSVVSHVSPCCEAEVVEGGNSFLGRKFHIAKKYYRQKDFEVRPGDYYERRVWRYWRKDGPSWFVVRRMRQKKGPLWDVPSGALSIHAIHAIKEVK